jgi:hypothetical protein
VAQDTRQFVRQNGLDVQDLWLRTQPGHALDPEFLRSVDLLTRRLEQHAGINAVEGPTTLLRWARYIQSGTDELPTAADAWPKLAADLEQILLTEPGARSYVDVAELSSVRLSIRGRAEDFGRSGAMRKFILQTWTDAQAQDAIAADADAEFRDHRQRHFLRLSRGISQPCRAPHDDDSVVFCDPVGVHRNALGEHSSEHRDNPHRLDRARSNRKRSSAFFLSPAGGPCERQHERRAQARDAHRRPADCVRDAHQYQRLFGADVIGSAADAAVRRGLGLRVRIGTDCRLHRVAERTVDPVAPRPIARRQHPGFRLGVSKIGSV